MQVKCSATAPKSHESFLSRVFGCFFAQNRQPNTLTRENVRQVNEPTVQENIFLHNESEQAFLELLTAVVKGKKRFVITKLSQLTPAALAVLLTQTSKQVVTDYSGRQFKNVTLFEAALLVHQVAANDRYSGLCEFIVSKFVNKEVCLKQYRSIFPRGAEITFAYLKLNCFNFSAIIKAFDKASSDEISLILNDSNKSTNLASTHAGSVSETLQQSIAIFRQHFSSEVLQTKHYNPHHLMQAVDIFYAHYNAWPYAKNLLFMRQVIGYIQRFTVADEAQIIVQGFYDVLRQHHALADCLCNPDFQYYPLLHETSGLGFDHMARHPFDSSHMLLLPQSHDNKEATYPYYLALQYENKKNNLLKLEAAILPNHLQTERFCETVSLPATTMARR